MSNNFVTLVLKTNIYKSKLIVIQHFASLVLEHYKASFLNIITQTPDFIDRLQGLLVNPNKRYRTYGIF